MCFSITGFSNLFANESIDKKFVYHLTNSKANWLRMTVNLIGHKPRTKPSKKFGPIGINNFFPLVLILCYFLVIIFINGPLFKRNPDLSTSYQAL